MPRTLAALLPLLAGLDLSLPRNVAAGPPEPLSGAMKLDTVADGLREYSKETDQGKRIRWLVKLAPTGDPRVAVTLWGLFEDRSEETVIRAKAVGLLARHFAIDSRYNHDGLTEVYAWWVKNEADLRRRAKQFPQ
jgi:hypothetical protein